MRILVAEDERNINEIICKELKKNHYSVDACFDGQEALDHTDFAEYDVIILDVMMPKVDGFSVVRSLRQRGNKVPVLFLTARGSIEDRVQGLDGGGDDYLVKPFALDELLARVRVLLRRQTGHMTNIFTLGDLTVDCDRKTVKRGERDISLSSKEFSILEYLIRNQGIVLTRERIQQHIWNYDYEGGSNLIDVYIRNLRKKVDADFDEKLIHTVRGTGYVLRENNEKIDH